MVYIVIYAKIYQVWLKILNEHKMMTLLESSTFRPHHIFDVLFMSLMHYRATIFCILYMLAEFSYTKKEWCLSAF